MDPSLPTLSFDLGGTWFRAATVGPSGQVRLLDRVPAIGRERPADSLESMAARMVGHLVTETRRFGTESGHVAVSLGATIDLNTGVVLASAPLWGPGECRIDVRAMLAGALPGVAWTVVNDVSALAADAAAQHPDVAGWLAAVTVSSGIAYRLIDTRTGYLPRDPRHGLQGEIGHLPAVASWRGDELRLACDCGAEGHVSAYSSGPGIREVLARLPAPGYFGPPGADPLPRFTRGVRAGDPVAVEVLDTVTRPLATVLLYQATLNPEVRRTVLTGGVVEGLGTFYLESLLRNLGALGLYRITPGDPGYFARGIVLGGSDGFAALRGAALLATGRIGAGRIGGGP